nr:hypothetical protein [Catenulispora acidiphila]
MYLGQPGTRLDSDLVDQQPSDLAEDGQGLGPAAGVIQREHPLLSEPLVHRMTRDQRRRLGGDLGVPAQEQAGVEPVAPELQVRRRQRFRLLLHLTVGDDVGQRIATPLCQGLFGQGVEAGPVPGVRLGLGCRPQGSEPDQIQLVLGQLERIAAGAGEDPRADFRAERPTQAEYVARETVGAGRSGSRTPRGLDQPPGVDDLVGV